MQEINLLQNQVKDTTYVWQRQGRLIKTVLSVILIVLAGLGALFYLLSVSDGKKSQDLITQNMSIQQQLNEQQDAVGQATTFQAQLTNLKTLVGSHVYLSPLLDALSAQTYVQSQFLVLDITQSGKVHIEGKVKSYSDLGKLLLGLTTSDKFTNVKLLSVIPAQSKDNAYQFALDLNVSPTIFTKK